MCIRDRNTSSDTASSTPKTSESKKSGSGNSNGDTGWFFAQVQVEYSLFNKKDNWDDMRRVVLLDNQSSENVFSNAELVRDIRPSKKALQLATNAGVLRTNQVCNSSHVWRSLV